MPAMSRKRNKGKDRKAKKAAEKAKAAEEIEAAKANLHNTWQSWFLGHMVGPSQILRIECNHGIDQEILPDKSHPVSSFIDSYFYSGSTLKDVWNNDNNRKLASTILTSIGTNLLCSPRISQRLNLQSQQFALTITMLENYDEALGYDSTANPIVAKKYRDLHCGNASIIRDLLKFFRKRITCSCLKKMHLEARKTQPKMRACGHCKEVKERSLLIVCSRCMVHQYCSRKCQVAASPEHKKYCVKFMDSHKEQQQAK